jgi:DNA-binding transcriptional LysR family regulator
MGAVNQGVLRGAAVSDRGIALLPTFIAAPGIRSGKLQVILAKYPAPELSVCALYPPTCNLSVKVHVFVDFLVERFGNKPYWDVGIGLDKAN